MFLSKLKKEEKEVLIELQKGSYEAFKVIYHRYKSPLASYMLRLLKSSDLVDDLLQDLFTRVWHRRSSIDADQPISAYLFRIAEHLVYDVFRKASKDNNIRERIFQALEKSHTDFTNNLEAKERKKLLDEAIALLPAKRREVYIMCKLEERSYEEVGTALNLSVSTINDHIYKANKFLRIQLNKHLDLILLAYFHYFFIS